MNNGKEYTVKLVEKYEKMDSMDREMISSALGIGLSLTVAAICHMSGNNHMWEVANLAMFGINTAYLLHTFLMRIGIEKDIEELKQELGLGELETEKGKSR